MSCGTGVVTTQFEQHLRLVLQLKRCCSSQAATNPLGFVELLPVFQEALIINWNWPDSPKKHCVKYGLTSRRAMEQEWKCIYFLMEKLRKRKNVFTVKLRHGEKILTSDLFRPLQALLYNEIQKKALQSYIFFVI